MKKLILSVLIASVMVAMAKSGEYRNFTSQDGRTIVAKIIGYDVDADKVQLELENRKKAWVQLSDLSEVDQVYIQNTGKPAITRADKPNDEHLSRKKVEAVAEKYAEAWEEHDFDAWKSLLDQMHAGSENLKENVFNRYDVSSVSVGTTDEHNVHLKMKFKGGHVLPGWLQITPEGQIKYTPLLFKHPIYNAFSSLRYLHNDNPSWSRTGVKNLSEAGIPLFDYKVDAPKHVREKSIDEIIDWLIENGSDWDASEPKLYCPEKQFKECVSKYK
jgi:hypothetical protein